MIAHVFKTTLAKMVLIDFSISLLHVKENKCFSAISKSEILKGYIVDTDWPSHCCIEATARVRNSGQPTQ